MKLTVFQSDKGDCLLLTGNDGTRILVDGGMRDSYREHVAPALAALNGDGGSDPKIDLLYVSHIDRDHIGGVLQMMDDMVDWRVHDYQRDVRKARWPKPADPRPPEVKRVWHNAFTDQVDENVGPIEDVLAMTGSVLEAARDSRLHEAGAFNRDLATSVGDGVELTRRLAPDQLDIPLNEEFGRKLIYVRGRQKPKVRIGRLQVRVIAPFEEQLTELRKEWNEWLEDNKAEVARLREEMRRDAERLESSEEVKLFRSLFAARAGELGDRSRVTAPNLASLMLMVSEGRSCDVLLTGDGHPDEILRGLDRHGMLKGAAKGCHVRVLKVPHHASEYNVTPEFCRRVTADHYVICGNGEHENPDLRALDTIIDSRLGDEGVRSTNARADDEFHLWFNSSSAATPRAKNKRHMEKVEALVARRAGESGGRMHFRFLDEHAFELDL